MVEHKINGYIAEYKNQKDMETSVKYLLNLPPWEIEKIKQYSINKIKNGFTVEKMTDQYIRLYETILNK